LVLVYDDVATLVGRLQLNPDDCCPLWWTASPGRTAHPPASRFSGPSVRYLLDFPATGSGGHPCPYGASFGILPHVACKSNV